MYKNYDGEMFLETFKFIPNPNKMQTTEENVAQRWKYAHQGPVQKYVSSHPDWWQLSIFNTPAYSFTTLTHVQYRYIKMHALVSYVCVPSSEVARGVKIISAQAAGSEGHETAGLGSALLFICCLWASV